MDERIELKSPIVMISLLKHLCTHIHALYSFGITSY